MQDLRPASLDARRLGIFCRLKLGEEIVEQAESFSCAIRRELTDVEERGRKRLLLERSSGLWRASEGERARPPVPQIGGGLGESRSGDRTEPEDDWDGAEPGEGVALEVCIVQERAASGLMGVRGSPEVDRCLQADDHDGGMFAVGCGEGLQMLAEPL